MTDRIFLIGYRGTGKSTVAQLLAAQLGWDWCDADQVLEQRFSTTIRQIFDQQGETSFRNKESQILAELAKRRRCVIATGGGVVLREENRAQLKSGTTVWLTAEAGIIWQRLQGDASTAERRPNLVQGGFAEVQQLLHLRQPLYQMCADWTIDTSTPAPAEVAEAVARWLQASGHVDILKA